MFELSGYISIMIQLLTGFLDILGLLIPLPKNKLIFKDLLRVELGVQTVELIFYGWMVWNFNTIKNITPYRYFDWFITTPIMLITLVAYLKNESYSSLWNYIQDNKSFLYTIVFLNASMLLFGLLGELKILPYSIAITLGFIPFIIYYKKIYDEKIKEPNQVSQDKKNLFWFFFFIWTLYGISAYFPYSLKNTMYNVLDLFSKNGFGLFLVYVVWKNRIH